MTVNTVSEWDKVGEGGGCHRVLIKWLIDGGHVLEGTSGSEEHGVAKCAPESFGLSIWNFSSEYTVLHILYGAKMGTRELFAPSRFYIDNN